MIHGLDADDVINGPRRPRPLRGIYSQVLRETTHHCGPADVLHERVLATR